MVRGLHESIHGAKAHGLGMSRSGVCSEVLVVVVGCGRPGVARRQRRVRCGSASGVDGHDRRPPCPDGYTCVTIPCTTGYLPDGRGGPTRTWGPTRRSTPSSISTTFLPATRLGLALRRHAPLTKAAPLCSTVPGIPYTHRSSPTGPAFISYPVTRTNDRDRRRYPARSSATTQTREPSTATTARISARSSCSTRISTAPRLPTRPTQWCSPSHYQAARVDARPRPL